MRIRRFSLDGDGHILQPFQKDGVAQVKLCVNGEASQQSVHRLCAMAFLPNPFDKKNVIALDGNYNNLTLDNFAWASKSECHKLTQSTRHWLQVLELVDQYNTDDPELLRNLNKQYTLSPIKV
jgi:hypothetical protein